MDTAEAFVMMVSLPVGTGRVQQEPGSLGSRSESLCDHRQPWAPVGPCPHQHVKAL